MGDLFIVACLVVYTHGMGDLFIVACLVVYTTYFCGPAGTNALPSAFPSYFAKFLMNLSARSKAFVSHSEASA